MQKRVVVVGGGAAGMIAAGVAASQGAHVTLLERNSKLGKKLSLTGKGRCNITNNTDIEGIIRNIPGNGKFLYPALQSFNPEALRDFFARFGVATKVERGERVFPVSDKALDVVTALEKFMVQSGVKVKRDCRVESLKVESGAVTGVFYINEHGKESYKETHKEPQLIAADAVVLATGGASYPGTGSTGDGYRIAAACGHKIVEPKPALVPLVTKEPWVKQLQGLSLKNANVLAFAGEKKLGEEFGEMLFTHFGVSGPVILTLSRQIGIYLREKKASVKIVIDLKPALTEEKLDARIQRDFEKFNRKQFKNALDELLPKKLVPVIIDLSGINPDKPVHQVTREERKLLTQLLKNLTCTVTNTRLIDEAIVTAGGVSVKEINPRSMESKLLQGLFFAGELVDVDGFTGGFNLQAAFSMGYLAGTGAARL